MNATEAQNNDVWTGQINLFADVDHGSARTTGQLAEHRVAPEARVDTQLADHGGGSGDWTVTAGRHDLARGWVQTSHGRITTEVRDDLAFRSAQQLRDSGNDVTLHNGTDLTRTTATWGGGPHRTTTVHEDEPLDVTYRVTHDAAGNTDQLTAMDLGYHREATAPPAATSPSARPSTTPSAPPPAAMTATPPSAPAPAPRTTGAPGPTGRTTARSPSSTGGRSRSGAR